MLLKMLVENKKLCSGIVARVEESIASCKCEIKGMKKRLEKVKIIPLDNGWREKAKAQF
jgi:hypothetical protein